MTIPSLAPPAPDLKHYRAATTLTMRGADEGLPAGVVGQVEGVAMVYDVIDSHGTTFARGCFDRTCRERVAAGKVRLFLDHGDAPSSGMYDTHLHIGTVRELVDEQDASGRWVAKFRADIFDTESGRSAHEYLKAVAATASETGVSIGMLREPATTRCKVDGIDAFRIAELALGEISVTSMSSVPGTRVTAVRADPITAAVEVSDPGPVNYFALLDGLVAHLGIATVRAHLSATHADAPTSDSSAATASDADAGDSQGDSHGGAEPPVPNASVEERIAFARANFHRLL